MSELPPTNKNQKIKAWMQKQRSQNAWRTTLRKLQEKQEGLLPIETAIRLNKQEIDKMNVWDAGDMVKGVGNGLANAGIATYDLVAGALGGASSKKHLYPLGSQESVSGSLTSGIVQWLTGFALNRKIAGGFSKAGQQIAIKKTGGKAGKKLGPTTTANRSRADIANLSLVGSYTMTGLATDFTAWHPAQGNLSTYLEMKAKENKWKTRHPAFWGAITDYLSIPVQDYVENEVKYTDQLLDRLKNTGEGALFGTALGSIAMLLRNNRIRMSISWYEGKLNKLSKQGDDIHKSIVSKKNETKGIVPKGDAAKIRDELGILEKDLVDTTKESFKTKDKLSKLYNEAIEKQTYLPNKELNEIDTSSSGIGSTLSAKQIKTSPEAMSGWDKIQPELGVHKEGVSPEGGALSQTVNSGKNYNIKIDPRVTSGDMSPDEFFSRMKGEHKPIPEKGPLERMELTPPDKVRLAQDEGPRGEGFREELGLAVEQAQKGLKDAQDPLIHGHKGKVTQADVDDMLVMLREEGAHTDHPAFGHLSNEQAEKIINSKGAIKKIQKLYDDHLKKAKKDLKDAEAIERDPVGLERSTEEVWGKETPSKLNKAQKLQQARDKMVWEELTKSVPEKELREILNNPKQMEQFLLLKNREFIRQGGVPPVKNSDLILNEDSIRSEVEASIDALTQIKWQSPMKWGGKVVPHDFSGLDVPSARRGNLYEIGADGSYIVVDPKGIIKDVENNFAFIKGMQENPVTSQIRPASADELEVFLQLGIDPRKFGEALMKQGGGKEGAAKMYQKFFELRGRHIVRLAAKEKIPLNTISIANPNNNHILTQATHDAIYNSFNKGGLDIAFNTPKGTSRYIALKSDLALQVTPKGQFVDYSYVESALFGKRKIRDADGDLVETTGLEQLGKVIDDYIKQAEKIPSTKSPAQHAAAQQKLTDLISKGGHNGKLWNFQTQGSHLPSNAVAAALSRVLEKKFASHFGTDDSFASTLGWQSVDRSGMDARQWILKDLNHTIGVLAERCKIPREELIDVLAKGDRGVFEGSKLKKIDLTPEELAYRDKKGLPLAHTLNGGDIRTLHSRVLGLRIRIQARGDQLAKTQQIVRKNKELFDADANARGDVNRPFPEDMQKARVDMIRAMTMQLHDMYSLSLARSEAGRLLRAFRDLDNYTKNGAVDQQLIKQFYDDIVEGFGGSKTIDDVAEGLSTIKETEDLLTTGTMSLDAVLRESELMAQASGMDIFRGVQEMWINAILSGTQTQLLNNAMNLVKGLMYQPTARAIGSHLSDTGYFGSRLAKEKRIDPVKKGDLGQDVELDNAVAKSMDRDAASRSWIFSMRMAKDLLNIFRKGSPEKLLDDTGDALVDAQRGSAKSNSEHIADSVRDPENKSLGFSQDLMHNQAQSAADPEKLMAATKRVVFDHGGTKAYEGLRKLEQHPVYKRLASMYMGAYDNSIRLLGMKAMTGGDQFWKRTFMSGYLDGTLWAYGRNIGINGRKITDPTELAQFVAKHRENLILPNGQAFSKHNLRLYSYERALAPAPNGLGLKKGSREASEAAAEIEARHWHLLDDADPSIIIWRGEERAALAAKALDDAEELVFQRGLKKDVTEVSDFQTIQRKLTGQGAGGRTDPESAAGAYAWAANRWPVIKLFTPFIRTPFNLQRDFTAILPLLGKGLAKHKADMISGDPMRMNYAKGRQALGWAATIWATNLAIERRISGRGPQDFQERQAWEANGYRANSLMLPNGDSIEYGRLEPFATLFKAAANIAENYNRLRGDEDEESVYHDFFWSVVNGMGYTLMDSVGAKGLFTLFEMVDSYGGDDETAMRKTKAFAQKLFSSGVPRFLQHPTDALDTHEREPHQWEDFFLKKVFRWAVPKRRDPLFGYEIPIDDKFPNRWIKTFSPAKWKAGSAVEHEGIYSEILSIHGFSARPSLYKGKSGYDIKLTNYGAKVSLDDYLINDEDTVNKPESKLLRNSAENFKTPDGTPCPIHKDMDAYEFIQQYNGLVRRAIDPSDLTGNWATAIPSWNEGSMTSGEQKDAKALVFAVEKFLKNNKKLTLEETLANVIKSPEYRKIAKEANYVLHEKSFRLYIIKSITTRWRATTMNEVFGPLVDINEKADWTELWNPKNKKKNRMNLRLNLPLNPEYKINPNEPAIPYNNGIIAIHWPELARDWAKVQDETTDWNNNDIMQERMQQRKTIDSPKFRDAMRHLNQPLTPKE